MRAVTLFALCGAALAAGSIGNALGSADPLLAKMANIREHRRARRQRAQKPMVLSQREKDAQMASAVPQAVPFQIDAGTATTTCGDIQWSSLTCTIEPNASDSTITPNGQSVDAYNVTLICTLPIGLYRASFLKNVTFQRSGEFLIVDDQTITIGRPLRNISIILSAGSSVYANFDASTTSAATYIADSQSVATNTASALNFDDFKVCSSPGQVVGETKMDHFQSMVYNFLENQWTAVHLDQMTQKSMAINPLPSYDGAIVDNSFSFYGRAIFSQRASNSLIFSVNKAAAPEPYVEIKVVALILIVLIGNIFATIDFSKVASNNVLLTYNSYVSLFQNSQTAIATPDVASIDRFILNNAGALEYQSNTDTNFFLLNTITSNQNFAFASGGYAADLNLYIYMQSGWIQAPNNLKVEIVDGHIDILNDTANVYGTAQLPTSTDQTSISPIQNVEGQILLVAIYPAIGYIQIISCELSNLNGKVSNIPSGSIVPSTGLMAAKSTLTAETFTASLDAGAELDLSGPGLSEFVAVLPAGVLNPNTFCFSMSAGAQLAVKRSSTGHVFPGARLPVDAKICPDGRLSNTASGEVIGYISIFGTIKFGGAPPVGIPPKCMDMVTGMMVLVQRGGYANALETCTTHGLSPLDVTGTNIAAASALLEACGGLVVSAYVGSFNSQTNGGCLALFTAATSGTGTVATAPCNLNKPVICVETP